MSKERYLRMYELMVATRSLDETLIDLFKAGEIPGFIHAGIGHEAIGVGACFDLNKDDYVYVHHRGFAAYLSKGAEPEKIAAEFCGKETGYSKGKGGFHIAVPEIGIMGIGGSVGTCFPLSVGTGLTAIYNKKQQVIMCFFGDGTANREVAGSSMNMASLWKLPIVFICENNRWAITTSMKNSTATAQLSDRAAGYGMPGVTIDGTDILAVNETINKAVERARRGEGPSFIECMTIRWHPHAEGYPYFGAAKDAEEGPKHCPIEKFRKILAKVAAPEEIAAIDAQVEDKMKQVKEFAINSPHPTPESALEDVYAGRVINA